MNDIMYISSAPIEIAEFDTHKIGTFLISVLDEYDLVGRKITKEAGEACHSTIIGFPIVAKLVKDLRNNPVDFKGHEMKIQQEWNGAKTTTFDTFPIGSVIESWIEERNVEGYDQPKSCIMIRAKLWSNRYPEYFKVLDKLWAEGKVHTSWEIKPLDVEELSTGQKIFKAFSFLGNAILGSKVAPAVPNAGMVEYAELTKAQNDFDVELSEALEKDININKEQEEKSLDEIKNEILEPEKAEEASTTEPVAESEATADPVEEAAPTADEKPATEEAEVTNPAAKSLEDEISELKAALLAASEYTQALTAEVESLRPIRERFEQEEAAKKEEERRESVSALKQYALSSRFITEEEISAENSVIAEHINSLNEAAIKDIILERFMASLATKEETAELPEKKVKPATESASIDDDTETSVSLVKLFIQK